MNNPNATLDDNSKALNDPRAQAESALNRLATDAEHLTRRGLDAVHEGSQRIRNTTRRATDTTVDYVRNEPVKSVLIGVAVVAALVAIVSLARGARNTRE